MLAGHPDIEAAYQWDKERGYSVPAEFVAGKGYWIYADQAAQIVLTGLPASGAVALNIGWTLVAPLADSPDPMQTNDNVLAVWAWTPLGGYALPDQGDPLPCKAGNAYWIYSLQQTTIWE